MKVSLDQNANHYKFLATKIIFSYRYKAFTSVRVNSCIRGITILQDQRVVNPTFTRKIRNSNRDFLRGIL